MGNFDRPLVSSICFENALILSTNDNNGGDLVLFACLGSNAVDDLTWPSLSSAFSKVNARPSTT